ncbi:hypothetical protein SLA2020_198770 [Shorea laevis]
MDLLMKAAQAGDIDTLYTALAQDPNPLQQIDMKPLVETPLHIAASAGHTEFALEILRLKPSFAYKVNKNGFSPMHVALQHGQKEMALRLINALGDLVRVKGRAGTTPLHYVAEKGDIYLLIRFLSVCPKGIEDVTDKNETALHIALKNDKLVAFEVLLKWLEIGSEEGLFWEKKILNWKDNDDNTILQLAISRRELQVVKLLENCKAAKYLDGLREGHNQLANEEVEDGNTLLNVKVEDGTEKELRTKLSQIGSIRVEDAIQDEVEDVTVSAMPSAAFFFLRENANFLRADQRLKIAAQEGDTNALYEIFLEDPNVLERIDQVPFAETPLHIAASAGRIRFAEEIMRLKPSFARKVNQDGLSPLHLALENKRFKIAFNLLAMDKELVHVRGKGGLTALHYAAKEGNGDLLAKLIATCPKSIEDLTVRRETALHVATRNDNLICLKILCRWLQKTWQGEVLEWTDDEGNTIFDIAVKRNNTGVIEFLRNCGASRKVIHKFMNDLKAMENSKNRVEKGKGRTSKSPSLADLLKRKSTILEMLILNTHRRGALKTTEDYSMILVAYTLVVIATYQAVLSPPGGVWQGDLSILFPNASNTADDTNSTGINAEMRKAVGRTVMPMYVWVVFSIFNTAAFVVSLHQVCGMIQKRRSIFVNIVALLLFCCYGTSLCSIGPHRISTLFIVLYVCLFTTAMLVRRVFHHPKGSIQKLAKIVARRCKKYQD